MSKPVDSICSRLYQKLDIIKKACLTCGENKNATRISTDVESLRERISQESIIWLHKYSSSQDKKSNVAESFTQWVSSEGIVVDIDTLYNDVSQICTDHTILRDYKHIDIDMQVKKVDYKICTACGGNLTIYPHTSEMRCGSCGSAIILKGTVFDETQYYNGDTNNSQLGTQKRGTHETNKHCRSHLDKILALVSCPIPDDVSKKIDVWMVENGYLHAKAMKCEVFRDCLKGIKETSYNDCIPSIRLQKTGISPQKLTHEETQQVFIYFDMVVNAINEINNEKPHGNSNMRYYPFFIRKILEIILCKREDRQRLQSIIENIHFQRDDTITANDKLWERVCEIVPAFKGKFRKTEKNISR